MDGPPMKESKLEDDAPASLWEYWRTYWGNELPETSMKIPSTETQASDIGNADEDQDIEMDTYDQSTGGRTDNGEGLINIPLDGDLLPNAQPIPLSLDNMPHIKFLVRADYLRVYDAVNTFSKKPIRRKRPAAIVTGQPGIGKSVWIHYAIRRRLGSRLPTIWYQKGGSIRFDESGASRVKELSAVPKSYWCFIDSSEALEGIPVEISSDLFEGFPIYVRPPTELCWKRLHKSMSVEVFLMNPWTWQEMEYAALLRPSDSVGLQKARERFYKLGRTPRICFSYVDHDVEDFEALRAEGIRRLDDPSKWLEDTIGKRKTSFLADTPTDLGGYMGWFSQTIFLIQRPDINTVSTDYVIRFMSKSARHLCLRSCNTLDLLRV